MVASSAPGSPGSCSAATSTPPTPSWPCRPRCSPPVRWPASSRCPTRSCSTRSSSSSWRGCGRSATATATSPPPTSSAGATTAAACRWPSRCTGFVATMPYIALQLVGIQAVLEVAGVGGGDNIIAKDAPLFIAFAVLAAFTYSSGLRAPAVIAFVKDILIYLVIIVAVIYLPGQVGGWDNIFGSAQEKMATVNEATGKPTGAFLPGVGAGLGVRHPRARLGDGAVHVPALGDRVAVVQQPQHDPPQRRDPAGVLLRARPAGPARLGRHRRRHEADRARRRAQRAARHPAAVRGHVPGLVRRRRLRRHRDRRARAGGDHVDRRGQHVQPQHLQGVAQARRHPEAGGQGLQADVAARQGVRAGLRAHPRQAERDQLPAPRRHLDPPDLPRGRLQPLHPVVPPLGAAGRLGGRDGLRHGRGLPGGQPGHRQALRRLARA